ncbi:MAG: HAD hydrolase-like protein [Polyangia bacterium]
MSERRPSSIVLFDIDGTLLGAPDSEPSAGFAAMNCAAEELTGKRPYEDVLQFAGRTDVQIARAMLELGGEREPARERVDLLLARYLELLAENVKNRPYVVLGDPRAAVGSLESAGAAVGLGTGNLRSGGLIKLYSAGIDGLFDMSLGGYGDDGHSRAEVLAAGARRCDPSGESPVVIVGDTPHDVWAAHEIGAPCVGVPYRGNNAEVLRDAGADVIVESVQGDLADIVEALI